jgi:N-acetylmuramoyl-L-alanine amidase
VAVAGETGADAGLPVLSELAPRRAIRAIAIDAGHGGDDIGTRGPEGSLEKDVTLAVAQRLRNRIESELGLRVVLTRTGDSTVSLDERAAIANNDRADLFISLHANASVRETATGAEVFYLSLAEYGDEARDAGFTGQLVPTVGGGTRVLDIVPWEMAQLRHADQSARWAETVADELSLRVPMSPRGLQQAPFRVLVGANMPAVVLEMGFISNTDQEAQLTSTTFQSSIVSGLLRSIIRYRDEIASEGTPVAPRDAVPPDATGRSR